MPTDVSVVARVQLRTLVVLAGVVVLGGLGLSLAITAGGLLVARVSGVETLAGLGQTAIILGAASFAVPLARISAARGRRIGLSVGLVFGSVGALIVVVGSVRTSLPVVLVGLAFFGGSQATILQTRFTATDLSQPKHVGRDLSIILWMSAVGAIIGPNLAGPAADTAAHLALPELSGPFIWAAVGLVLGVILVLVGLRPDPLLLAKKMNSSGTEAQRMTLRDTWQVIRDRPRALLAVLALMSANAAMVGLMVMTPLQLQNGGQSLRIIGVVISVHVAGMFLFAPLFGVLADRIGQERTIAAGCFLLIGAGLMAAAAADNSGLVTVSLFALGLGWSMCLVAGSALLTSSVDLASRASVQGLADLMMGLAAATAGALAGVVFGIGSYAVLGLAVAVIVVPILVLTVGRLARTAER